MTATTLPTPADLSITPRDRRFGRDAATPRLWHGGRVEATAIYNALSATFPIGEAYFDESVRAFREGVLRRPDAKHHLLSCRCQLVDYMRDKIGTPDAELRQH